MVQEALLERLSAYADGELDAAECARMETALAHDAELRRALAQFRRLDGATAGLPAPQLDASAAAALWTEIAQRTFQRGLPAAGTEADWAEVAGNLAPAPELPEERWQTVWAGIQARTSSGAQAGSAGQAAARVSEVRLPAPARVRTAAWWRAAGALALAAGLLLGVTLFALWNGRGEFEPPTVRGTPEVEPAEVLDDRYFMMVKHVPGIETPVVCFFLKDPEADLKTQCERIGIN